MTDLPYLPATEALRRFRSHELSPVELLDAVIARAEAGEPTVNALCHTFYDQAREHLADAVDKLLKEPKTQVTGLQLIAAAGATDRVKQVIGLIDSSPPDPDVQLEAVRTLGRLKTAEAVAALRREAQTATVKLPNGRRFTAPVLNPSFGSTPPPQVVTYNAGGTGVDFFAGEVDDPFFFDIPAFGRFIASIRNGSPDPSLLMRGRDTFAGYNILSIALRFPVSMLRGTSNIIGADFLAQRATQEIQEGGRIVRSGPFHTLDRMGNPAVNVALVPFNRKDQYNAASTEDDADGQFASGIVATLRALGTSTSNINILAEVAVLHGDFLRLDVSIPNSGPGGGGNQAASFPNGRRLRDDVIDILLNIISNGAIVSGDNVNANDVPLGNAFPFLAPPHQPLATGVIDDKTRN